MLGGGDVGDSHRWRCWDVGDTHRERCWGHPPWRWRCRGHPPWLDDVVLGCWGHPPWTRGDVGDVGDTHRGDGDVGDTHRVEARIANDCLAELSVTGNTVTLAGLIAGTTTVRGRQRRRPCRIGGGGLRSAGQPSRGADWASYFSGAAPAIDGSAGAGLDGQHIYLWRDEDIALVDDVGDTHRGRWRCWGHPPWRWRCWGHPPRRSAHRQRLPGRTVRDRQHRHPRRTDRGHDHGPGTTAAPPMPNRRRWPSKCRSAIPRRRLGLLLQWRRASHRRQRGRGPRRPAHLPVAGRGHRAGGADPVQSFRQWATS